MITKEKLKDYASKLMFDMDEKEYDTLLEEFNVILKQMDLIGEIKDIDQVEPMTFPFELNNVLYEDDIFEESLKVEEVLKNSKDVLDNQIKIPKVVGNNDN